MSLSPPPQDHYKILGVPKDATLNTIRSVYRKLVLTTHPDKFQDEAVKAKKVEEFHQVQKAWETLSDEKERERYDALCRLAELKAERFREEGSRKKDSPYSPRPAPERSWGGGVEPVFEEIRPKEKRYEESRSSNLRSPEPRSSPRHDDFRPRARDFEDYDDCIPAFGISKKGSSTTARSTEARQEDGASRAKNRFRTAVHKVAAEKAREREYEDRRRTRDKTRRDDGQTKRTHVRLNLDGDYASDVDPEVDAFMMGGYTFKRGEGRPRSYEDEKHRSRRKHESRDNSPDRETKTHHNVQSAAEYIKKLSGKASSERESKRRPSISRAQSSSRSQPVPPPPPPPPMPPVEDVSRSAARKTTAKSGKSRREPIEILEPRRPSLTTTATAPSPSTLKPNRAATFETRGSEKLKGTFRRTATSPLAPSSSNTHSHKASRSRDSHDSGFSSSDAAEILTPRTTKTQYRVQVKGGADGEGGLQPEFELINPDQHRHSRHDSGGRSASYRGDRGGTSSRHAPPRSHTLDNPSNHRPAPLNRAATDKPSGMLFGEMPSRSSPEPREGRARYPDVRHSPHYSKNDVHYSSFPRRTSPTEMDSRRDHEDAYAGYERRGSLPMRPVRA